jgi:two-component system, OmpR family, sensor kinase
MFSKSIRWRLQLWVAFLLVCVLAGFGITLYQLQRIQQLNQVDEELGRRVATLSSAVRGGALRPPFERGPRGPGPEQGPGGPPLEIGPGPSSFDAKPFPSPSDYRDRGGPEKGPRWPFSPRERQLSSEATTLFSAAGTNDFYLAVWSYDGTLLGRSTNAPANLPGPERLPADTRLRTRTRGMDRQAFQFTEMGDCILAGCPLNAYASAMRRFTGLLFAVGSVVLAFGLGGGWWLTGRAIRPIAQISATASRISAGNLSERINVAEADNELGRLAAVLNSTFARLEASFAQQRQFTADASHELRTPLAVIISEAQTTLARERTAPEYREAVESCLGTAQQMRRLVESLLELARFDAGQQAMKRESFDVSQVVRDCVKLVQPLAGRRRIKIDCDLPALPCPGDSGRIAQVVTNLLTNAIAFNRDQGEVWVSVDALDSNALIKVADTGEGIPAEDLPHIFERFYRVDKSRSSLEGRTGLGLAICKAIVTAHKGTIEVASQPGAGSTFTVKLPLLNAPLSGG